MPGGIDAAFIAVWTVGIALNVVFVLLRAQRMRREGRPIVPQAPKNAAFAESRASGRWLNSAFSRLGGARNALLIYVQSGRLRVTPTFPFSLLPMPKARSLDIDTPLSCVTHLEVREGAFGRDVRLQLSGGAARRIELRLRDPDAFIAALQGAPRLAAADAAKQKPFMLTFTRAVVLLWSCAAILISASLLPNELALRFSGHAVQGVVVGPASQPAENASGLVVYTAAGRRWTTESSLGPGMWRTGQTVRLYYLPSDPGHAREGGGLWIAVLFLVFGLVVLAFSLFGGRIVRWFATKVDAKPQALVR